MTTETISSFSGMYRWLSNFYNVPIRMNDGIEYPSSEHAYQAYKTRDLAARKAMVLDERPGAAKRWGQRITVRSDWDHVKVRHMHVVLQRKFDQHAGLAHKLRNTGTAWLIEGNEWGDTFWGQTTQGFGLNMLGTLLMLVRSQHAVRNGITHTEGTDQ
jgi:ribA/ribD-fused uncharacterized protein